MNNGEWIRRHATDDILKAIHTTDRTTDIYYISSKGGEGKTVLLRQVGLELGSPDGIAAYFPWSGILDLYHAEINSSSGLEEHLSTALESAGEFDDFHRKRDEWTARREAGLPGLELEVERKQLAELFAGGVNAVSRWERIVIALDTVERMQYEIDEVQKRTGLESESTTVRAWLLDQLCRWENCVVLLAGRPEESPYLGQALRETLVGKPGLRFHPVELGGFSEQEVAEYFEKKAYHYPALREIEPELRQRLWGVTEGNPIRLDLAAEIIQHGLDLEPFRQAVMQSSPGEVHEEIDRLLVDHVMRGEPDSSLRDVLRFLAIARKGLDAELLQQLAGEWDLEACRERLAGVAKRGFVKRPAGEERLFLHDELYILCDRHLLHADEVQRLSQKIVDRYEAHQETVKERKALQDSQVESLIYRLRANPVEGYRWYVREADAPIRASEVGFELRMRNEVLAFLNSKSPIDQRILRDAPGLLDEFNCDAVPNWIKRLMVRGENQRAVAVAEASMAAGEPLCPGRGPIAEIARAETSVYHAQALIYIGQTKKAVEILAGTIRALEGERKPDDLALEDASSYEGWRRNMILGRAHNNLGYVYWMHMGHLRLALTEFQAALPYFRASDLGEELANTNDNMGRVWALLRHRTRAETLVDDGLRLRNEQGLPYRTALSLNSRAIVHLEFAEPHRAERLATDALAIFRGIPAQRGIGLASITMGHALRNKSNLWRDGLYSYQDAAEMLGRAAEHLDRAVQIFAEEVQEPLRRVEALNELGCIYRARAALDQQKADEPRLFRAASGAAVEYLMKSIELAEKLDLPLLLADSCEDLAQVYLMRKEYDKAHSMLDRGEQVVPEGYRLRPGREWSAIKTESAIESFWLQLGKIELLRGNVSFDIGTENGKRPVTRDVLEETMLHYLSSTAYFERFSEQAVGLGETFRQMYHRFRTCSHEDLAYLQERVPDLAAEYGIVSLERLGRFFEDTLGLAIRGVG